MMLAMPLLNESKTRRDPTNYANVNKMLYFSSNLKFYLLWCVQNCSSFNMNSKYATYIRFQFVVVDAVFIYYLSKSQLNF
mmetsp:Transcript_493/g.1088  ORF Transcript_493/g.1088 Transcript_493/m.1088 type:complete len:80 (+) Transcript_493:1178-1417(+)